MLHRRVSLAVTATILAIAGPAHALDPAKPLSACSVEVWRAREGVRGWVRAIAQTRDGYLWIGTSTGLLRYGGGAIEPLEGAGERGADVVDLLAADDGTLWVVRAHGEPFCLRDGVAVACFPAGQHLPAGTRVVGLDQNGEGVWLTTADGLYGLVDRHLEQRAAGTPPDRAPRRERNSVLDRDGNLWSGNKHGLTRSGPGGLVTFTRKDGLPEDDVTAVFEDREGTLWVGTHGGGIAQFTDRTLDTQAGPPSLRERWINAVAEDEAGALWAGTRTGLVRWAGGSERTFTTADGLPSDSVLSVLPSPTGVWIGTEAGLARWRPGDGRIDRPVAFDEAVSALYLDGAGVLWLGGDALARVMGDRLDRIPVDAGVELNDVRGMQHDDAGVLWLSSGGKLFQMVDGRVRVPPPPAAAIGKVRGLHRDSDGTLWLGTFDGLVRHRAGGWHLFGAAVGMPDDVYQVLSDDAGFLWAGTSLGIVRLSKRALADVEAGHRRHVDGAVFHASDERREVDAARPHQPGAWRAHDGRLWFATARGVVSVDPARLRVNAVPPAVRIERALVDGRPARRGFANEFPPGSGALEFHFVAVTLLEPQRARHRYRLEGFDRDWIEAGTRRVAWYTNIRPGRYRFRVQGSNADGVWNEAGDAIDFVLAPHLYQTWWFYAACAASLLGLGLAFHRLRVAQVHSRYAATFAERNRMARELHDSLLQGMAAAVLRLRTLRKRVDAGETAQELEGVENLIGSNMEETRQLVWDLREQGPGEAPIEPALSQLVRRAAERSAIDVRLESEGAATPLPPRIARELLRIVQEALANALAHAQARHLEVRVIHDSDRVRVQVRDDGRGFDPRAAPGPATGHFGLAGMRERASAIGDVTIDSQPGRGTTVEVSARKGVGHG